MRKDYPSLLKRIKRASDLKDGERRIVTCSKPWHIDKENKVHLKQLAVDARVANIGFEIRKCVALCYWNNICGHDWRRKRDNPYYSELPQKFAIIQGVPRNIELHSVPERYSDDKTVTAEEWDEEFAWIEPEVVGSTLVTAERAEELRAKIEKVLGRPLKQGEK